MFNLKFTATILVLSFLVAVAYCTSKKRKCARFRYPPVAPEGKCAKKCFRCDDGKERCCEGLLCYKRLYQGVGYCWLPPKTTSIS